MNPSALDLTREFPRSPRERLGGYVHLPRMIDKARAKAAGTLGEYIYPCPLDLALLDHLGVRAEDFYQMAAGEEDSGVLSWLRRKIPLRDHRQIENWNEQFLNRRPADEEGMRHFLEVRNRIAPAREDVTTWVALIDLEEGRLG